MQESYLKVVLINNLRHQRILSPYNTHHETFLTRISGYESADLIPPSFSKVEARSWILDQRRAQAAIFHDAAATIARPDHFLKFVFLRNSPPRNELLSRTVKFAYNHPKFSNDAVNHN